MSLAHNYTVGMALQFCAIEKSSYFISPEALMVDRGYKDFLGKGAFGKVFRCYHQNASVAVKMFDLTGSREIVENTVQLAVKEMEMMLYLQGSARVVNLIGVTRVDDCMFGIVMEYLPRGSLFDLVQKYEIPWSLAVRMMFETASGLSYLHRIRFDKRMTHNDLKPENILFDENFHVKLCDFGGSNLALHSTGKLSRNQAIPSEVYSINYVAPEYITDSKVSRTRAMDVYSYGMILFFVLSKKPAFHHYDSATILCFLKNGMTPRFEVKDILSRATHVDKPLVELLLSQLNRCSDINPSNRPRIQTVESELESCVAKIDEKLLKKLEQDLVLDSPLCSASFTENRVRLQEKCKSIFVKKLHIPFDTSFSDESQVLQPLIGLTHNWVKEEKVKATSSSCRGQGTEKQKETLNAQIKQSASILTNVIVIDGHGENLCNGDKFIVQSSTRILTCVVIDTFTKDGG